MRSGLNRTPASESGLRHRRFVIYHDGSEFVAEPETPEDGDQILELGSQSVDQLLDMVDELWAALTHVDNLAAGPVPVPAWYQAWLDGEIPGRIRIDRPSTRGRPTTLAFEIVEIEDVADQIAKDGKRFVYEAGEGDQAGALTLQEEMHLLPWIEVSFMEKRFEIRFRTVRFAIDSVGLAVFATVLLHHFS